MSQVLQVGTSSVELDVPAGPFVRITGTGISLVVGGQTLTGDVSIERALSLGADGVVGGTLLDADTTVIKVAATNVSLAIGDGTRTVLTLTGGEALLVSRGTGIAASLSGTVALRNVPGVTLSGTFLVEINTLTTVVDETFTVGGTTRVLELPAATSSTTPLIRVRGQDVVVQLGDGLALGADITVTKVGTTLTVTVANGRIVLGNAASPLATLTGVNGTLVLTSAGIYGQVAANLQLDVPSVTLTASFKVRFNTTTTDQSITVPETATLTPGFRVVATGVTLGIAGQTLGGNIVIERIVGPGPTFTPEVRIAVADLTLTLGSAVTVLASHHWNGALLITSSGVAATFSGSLGSGTVADPYVFTLGTGITVGGAVALVVNTSPVAVDETFTVELPDGTSTPIHLVAPAGPAFQVSITGTLTVGTVVFTGSFVVAQSTRPGYGGSPAGGAVPTATSVTSIATGDVNGDGKLDLLIGTTASTSLFLGTGPSAFSAVAAKTWAGAAVGVVLADLDRDGRLDVVITGAGSTTVNRLTAGDRDLGDLRGRRHPHGPARHVGGRRRRQRRRVRRRRGRCERLGCHDQGVPQPRQHHDDVRRRPDRHVERHPDVCLDHPGHRHGHPGRAPHRPDQRRRPRPRRRQHRRGPRHLPQPRPRRHDRHHLAGLRGRRRGRQHRRRPRRGRGRRRR